MSDNEEDKIYSVIKVMIVALLTAVILLVGNCQGTKYQVRKAIEANVDPIVAACALTVMDRVLCTTAITQADER